MKNRFNGDGEGPLHDLGLPEPTQEEKTEQPTKKNRSKQHLSGAKFKLPQLTKRVQKEIGKVRCAGKQWFVYEEGIWNEVEKETFQPLACRVQNPDDVTGEVTDKILKLIQQQNQIPRKSFRNAVCWEDDKRRAILINARNGVVRVDLVAGNYELLPHAPDFLFVSQLLVRFDREAKCELFLRTLEKSLPDEDDRQLFRHWFSHCFLPHSELESCLICVGAAATGKSTTVLHGVGSVFEGRCRTAISLKKLCDNSDELRLLEGSLLNLGTEIDHRILDDSSYFKTLISGESIVINAKYRPSYELQVTTKFCFLANRLPSFKKGSEAESRRIRIIFFGNAVVGEAQDPTIKRRIEEEKDGIFMWLLECLVETSRSTEMLQGGILSRTEFDIFRVNNNPLGEFVSKYCVFGNPDEVFMVKQNFVKGFKGFIEASGVRKTRSYADDWIWQELYAMCPVIKGKSSDRKSIDGKQQYVLRGIDLIEEAKQRFLEVGVTKKGVGA